MDAEGNEQLRSTPASVFHQHFARDAVLFNGAAIQLAHLRARESKRVHGASSGNEAQSGLRAFRPCTVMVRSLHGRWGAAMTEKTKISRLSRREVLHVGGLGALSLFWLDWLHAEAGSRRNHTKAKSVILIFNCGAPSHIDLWDPKPEAPDTVRGQFQPTPTRVPGIRISELLPRLAERTDKLAIIRSVHHRHTSHNSGMYWSIVGRPYSRDDTLINPSRTDYPSIGTLVGWLARRDGYSGALPPYVITPAPHCDSTVYITPGQYGGCLGSQHDPLVVNSDPNSKAFKVTGIGLSEGLTPQRI